jgi:hypothetical protein
MAIIKDIIIPLILIVGHKGIAGCIEPQKRFFDGPFNVESCSYQSVTNARFEDSRLNGAMSGKNPYKNPTALLGQKTKLGKQKIFVLTPQNRGVLLTGKISSQEKPITAFLRTKDINFCEGLAKSNIVESSIVAVCCDCIDSCIDTPCAIGTRNEIIKHKTSTK